MLLNIHEHSLTIMQSENRKHTVHDSALQGNPGSNPLQDIIHDPNDSLFKRMHKHINNAFINT